jgi:protease PrsW
MIRIVIFVAAVAPPLMILSYWTGKVSGSWRSEAVWSAFFLGAVGAVGAAILEFGIGFLGGSLGSFAAAPPVAASAAKALLVAAIPEESIKLFILVALAEKHVDVRRFQDIIVLGLAVSLGFATLENFFYVTSAGDWKTIAGLRALTSVPSHGIDGLAMGALLASARLDGTKGVWPDNSVLFVPVLLHAAYDFPLFLIEQHIGWLWFGAAWLAVIITSAFFVIRLFNRVLLRAVSADRTSSPDAELVEKVDQLVSGGAIGFIAGSALQPQRTVQPIS